MSGSAYSEEGQCKQKEDSIPAVQSINLWNKKGCYMCQKEGCYKEIFRIVIREFPVLLTILLIRLKILNGVIISCSKEVEKFFKLRKDSTYGVFINSRSVRRSFERQSRKRSREENDEEQVEIFEPFICRLATSLDMDICTLEKSIRDIITSENEILLDFDYYKLTKRYYYTYDEIKHKIINIFWQPKSPGKASNSALILRSASKSRFPSRSHSLPRDHMKNDGWFEAVDNNLIVPLNTEINVLAFKEAKSLLNILCKCIHNIENNFINAFSWYFEEYMYRDLFYWPFTASYAKYDRLRKRKKIFNPNVIVEKNSPLNINSHFAYVLDPNLCSQLKYVQKYIRDNDLDLESIIRINKDTPFVIRSLNPITRKHIFHMFYKSSTYSQLPYEHIFNTLVLLKDAMLRLRLKNITMCKIGCHCERLSFGKILKMIEFIFMDTEIKVRIGLNIKKCWNFRSHSLTDHGQSSESEDLRLDRINPLSSCDHIVDNTEVRFSDEK